MRKKTKPMGKRKFRIGELAKQLKVKKYVIRFWEKEFGMSTDRSMGGQRFYTQKDVDTFTQIKYLLYTQGYTIAGARQQLKKTLPVLAISPARSSTPALTTQQQKAHPTSHATLATFAQKTPNHSINSGLLELKAKLLKLRKIL